MTHPSLRSRFAFALLLAGSALLASPSFAAAPMAKTHPPGIYRMMLGDFEITALNDGTVDLPVDKLLKAPAAKVDKALKQSYLSVPVETSVNTFLVNTGSKLVLIDAGAGALFGPTLGKLVANLKLSGYQPEQVDEIYITHMHPDHVGGLMHESAVAFPNAIVRADKRDADFWLSQANLDKATGDSKGFFQGAMASIGPYVKAEHFKPFEADGELVPGVSARASHGHTVGHTSYLVESKGQKLLLIGDLIHVAAVQLDDPTVTIAFDTDANAARAERLKTFAAAAKDGTLVGASHLSFPGLGHLRAVGKSYQWLPVNFTQLH
jgi:glyoxylase-like metal-dependent hydrolase (beta-lactamase superfamily II)